MFEIDHPTATPAQLRFWQSARRFRAFVGGIGSGKTRAGSVEVLRQPAGSTGMVVAPTYPMLRDATMRTCLSLWQPANLIAQHNVAENRIELVNGSTVLFRSADDPDRLRGPNLGWFWLDEGAMCASETWDVLLGRLREAPERGWTTTTPRGFNWVHERFTTDDPDYELVHARTTENQYLSRAFLDSLRMSYAAGFYAQEVDGEFVDLQSGGLFDCSKVEIVDVIPAGLRSVRWWDKAASPGSGDWTVGLRMCGPDSGGYYYVEDVARGQWGPTERDGIIRQTAQSDGKSIAVLSPQDPGQAGKADAQAFIRMLAGFAVRTPLETGDKVVRANPVASQVGGGFVKLLRAPWNRALLDELRAFPNGKHDDQVDALSGAFGALVGGSGQLVYAPRAVMERVEAIRRAREAKASTA